jgi:hypothetical protein
MMKSSVVWLSIRVAVIDFPAIVRCSRIVLAFSGHCVLSGAPDDQASVSRGMTLTVAERARSPIIGLRYGLPRCIAR